MQLGQQIKEMVIKLKAPQRSRGKVIHFYRSTPFNTTPQYKFISLKSWMHAKPNNSSPTTLHIAILKFTRKTLQDAHRSEHFIDEGQKEPAVYYF